MIDALIRWLQARSERIGSGPVSVGSFHGKTGFLRWAPFWPDEWGGKNRPPWWRPFNILLHCWDPEPGYDEEFHDHPRWSVTICLKGRIIERTPWGAKTLKPGSVVIRSRKAIHGFTMPEGHAGETWTLFIVGRRDHPQSTYTIVQRGKA